MNACFMTKNHGTRKQHAKCRMWKKLTDVRVDFVILGIETFSVMMSVLP